MNLTYNPEQVRSFIAIELPEEIKNGLARLRGELEREEQTFVKWVDVEGIHLTLKFLGNIPLKRVAEITSAMEEAAQGSSPFRLEVSNLGAFPNLKQPRVFWVGIGGEVDRLSSLQRNIDSALASLGFAREERPFTPHLTLARIRQGAPPGQRKSFGELVMSTSFDGKYVADVNAINLMRSQLTPTGAVYSCLAEVILPTQEC
ncbi:MAG: RNA 2',3'-cyclic phosphodiesterase [Dehalococcoidia bacterium]|nr:RNA 2',3'-cyclic phosphodiesterase [Dehalococcoidia bacterium]